MGHLRASCPRTQRPYPSSSNNYVLHADILCPDNGMVRSDDTVAHVNMEHGLPRKHCDSSISYNHNVCGSGALPSVPSSTHGKDKGQGMTSVNESSQIIANSTFEALSRKALSGGIDPRCVNKPYEENCFPGQGRRTPTNTECNETLNDVSTPNVNDPVDSPQPLEQVELSRSWEIEGREQIEDVRGRLKTNIGFWQQNLEPAPWILDCISKGYKLPLKLVPGSFIKKNQDSALKNQEFVIEALRELEANRYIEKVDDQPHICSPLG